MQVHYSIDQLPDFKKAVITIGTFDGVHEGHRKIIDALLHEAVHIGGEAVIITFHPHPRKVVQPQKPLHLINTLSEKITLLQKTGVHHLVIVPFTQEFSSLTAEEYIEDFLVNRFHPATIIIGYDHHFGKDRRGNFSFLQQYAAPFYYELQEIPKQVVNEIDVSSTKIRNAITSGDIDTANRLLGYTYFFEGVVVKGDQLGRQLGYPTANLQLTDEDKIHLGHGVYAVYVHWQNKQYKGMLSIGNRPTLLHSEEKIEVNIFDFDETIYGDTIQITVKKYLRAQEKYASLDLLTQQLKKDKEESLFVL